MHSDKARGAGRQKQHVALSEQMLGAHHVEHGARIDAGRHAEADPRREIGLDQAGDHVDARPLRGQHQVHADSARHLSQARYGLLDVGAFDHHQVGQFVDQDQDVWDLFRLFLCQLLLEQASRLRFELPHFTIVLVDVADALRRQKFQPPLHFEHGVSQRVGGLLGVGDHGREQVRDAFVRAELQALRIHHDHPYMLRSRLVQDGHNERVEHDALARSGRAGYQQVRHRVERGNLDAPADVLAEGHGERRGGSMELLRLEDLAQADDLAL